MSNKDKNVDVESIKHKSVVSSWVLVAFSVLLILVYIVSDIRYNNLIENCTIPVSSSVIDYDVTRKAKGKSAAKKYRHNITIEYLTPSGKKTETIILNERTSVKQDVSDITVYCNEDYSECLVEPYESNSNKSYSKVFPILILFMLFISALGLKNDSKNTKSLVLQE